MNGARWLAQGFLGWCNMLEDWVRDGGRIDPSTAATLLTGFRRLAAVLGQPAAVGPPEDDAGPPASDTHTYPSQAGRRIVPITRRPRGG